MKNSASSPQPSGSAERKWFARLRNARFTHLLIALSLLLFLSPLVGTFGYLLGQTVSVVLVVTALAVVLLAAALAVSDNARQTRVSLILAGVCVALTLLAQLFESPTMRIGQQILTIGFLTHVVQMIIRSLFRQHSVDYDTIAASLCGYLLIGVVFAVVYSLAMEINVSAISNTQADQTSKIALRFGDRHTVTSLYFSFVTLTTLGYGDITPVSTTARMLTTAEALIGQLYLVVLVARLVGLHISNEMASRR